MATRNMVYEPAFWNCMKEMRELREQWAGEGCIGKAFLEKEKEMMGENGGCPFCGASH